MTFPKIRLPLLFVILSLSCLTAGPVMAQEKPESQSIINDEQRQLNVDSFDFVWKTVRDQYWDSKLGGLDWDALRDEFRPKVEAATTNEQARNITRELLDRLKVSHFGIIPAEEDLAKWARR